MNIIEVKNLNFSYGEKNSVFQNISFTIQKGDLMAIIGPNGTGKSTIVKIIAGLLNKKSGEVKVNGKISYIPQKYNQDPNFPARVSEILNLECCDCKYRDEVLLSLRINELVNEQFKNLSGGQQQRVFVALSLLSNPDVLILDEPTVGIDSGTQEEFYKLLKKLNKERNLTILFVTHDTSMVSNYFTKTMCIHGKKVFIDNSKNTSKILKEAYGENFQEHSHSHDHRNEAREGGQRK